MTIDKAIEDLEASKRWKCKPSNECIDMAIKVLEQQLSSTRKYYVLHKIADFFQNWNGDENAKLEISVRDMREISSMFITKCQAESILKALKQSSCEDRIIEWKKDFKEYINSLSMPRDDYKGVMEYIDELPVTSPEPCEDAISRSSLLGKLDDCYKEKVKIAPDNMAEGFAQVEKLIKQESPVTPTQRWIPVEEKSPKENGNYLVTKEVYFTPDHVDDINHYRTVSVSYYDTKYSWLDAGVYAWMPLPKSYEVTE